MRTLFDYDSYRDFLADRVHEKNITKSSVADRLGLKSKSYLGLILSAKGIFRSIKIHLLKDVLGLSSAEFDYFFHLVLFNDASSKASHGFHRRKLEELKRQNKFLVKTVQAREDVLSRWFYPALLLVLTMPRPLTGKNIAKRLKVSETEIQAAYVDLERQGLIKRDSNNDWQLQPVKLKIAKKTWNTLQRKFLKEQISNSLATFDESYEQTGKFYSQTLTLSKDGFDQVWASLKEKMDQIADQSDLETPEELIQLNLQFYRLL